MASERTIMASRFKAECLAILDQVERSRDTVVVTWVADVAAEPEVEIAPLSADDQIRRFAEAARDVDVVW